ncbi:MAG: DNA-directed RNA polymerase subunit A' [Candidatus Aenigmarchaeota archaeon]|nr:DNA-directed RNA polymerase subunit A' [Candidatus Aenigmarchaeota archaeon]
MINSMDFKLMSPQMIKKIGVVEIVKPELYDNDGFPLEGGVMDPRLGVIDPGLKCRTCGKPMGTCLGHFGYIELVRPVINVLYAKTIYKLLKMTCQSCGKIVSTSTTTTIKKCPHCAAEQAQIRFEKPYGYFEGEKQLTQTQIRERLERIPDEDLKEVGFLGGRPEWLVLTLLAVPPVIMRPSITLETGDRSEDDLTHKTVDIIRINQRLKENIEIGAPDFIIEDLWELLQYHVATFFDNTLAGIPAARHRSGRPLKTLADRLKSKEGRFRHNLSGKRVNFSARTVITPDPCLSINEVGVPLMIAKELTIPVSVNQNNIEMLRKLIMFSPNWPSANYVIRPDGKKKRITDDIKEEIAKEIEPGYIVERHLQNGDIVLYNRQPSLHRMSIMAHRVRITPWKTFTMNVCVCAPYNADFDGDEMNLHVLQTEEARSEAELLMEVQRHIRSPRYGGPIIGCEQDHISGIFMLTQKDNILTREEVFKMLADIGMWVELPKKKTLTGKEVFSLLLPKGLNISFKAKACGCDKCIKGTCPNDGYVVIKNGNLERGVIDVKAIGREAGKLIDIIEKEYGFEEAHKFIDRVAALGIRYIDKTGFTVGISDVDLNNEAKEKVAKVTNAAQTKVYDLIADYQQNKLEILPGRSAKESLEAAILNTLTKVSEECGKVVADVVKDNCVVIMAKSGARGSMTHVTQLSACVGQSRTLGERMHRGYNSGRRTLSLFKQDDLSAIPHGFIINSFKTGLNPIEFFFDAMSGRESLMDKSLRTRHSGYLERRLMNALQDLKVEYDGTVRDNRKVIIQFTPGEDGIDPGKSDWGILDVKSIIQAVLR